MTWEDVKSNIFVWKSGNHWIESPLWTNQDAASYQESAFISNLKTLYYASANAKNLLETITGNSEQIKIAISTDFDDSKAGVVPQNYNNFVNDKYLIWNPNTSAYFVDQFGKVVKYNDRVILAHELKHYSDPANVDPIIANMSDADFNNQANVNALRGPAVTFENQVATDLGIISHRYDYADAWDSNSVNFHMLMTSEQSWTFGHEVSVIRLGGPNPSVVDNYIDYSTWTGSVSVLALGLSGNDNIRGSSGNDYLHGNAGGDFIYGGAGNDYIFGNSPSGYFEAGDDYNYLEGEDGNDVIVAGMFGDTLVGGTGNDVLIGGQSQDVIYGGDDDDLIFSKGGADIIEGEDGMDRIVINNPIGIGSPDGTQVYGGAGNDKVWIENAPDRGAAELFPATYNLKDSDAGDILYWNGYQLHGGTWTVLIERLNPDIDDSYGLWVDNHGVIYDYHENSVLNIVLPDNNKVSIADFQNGDWGLTFNDAPNFYPWPGDGLPRAATAGLIPVNDSPGELFWKNVDMLDGRLAAAFTPGPVDMPTFTFA